METRRSEQERSAQFEYMLAPIRARALMRRHKQFQGALDHNLHLLSAQEHTVLTDIDNSKVVFNLRAGRLKARASVLPRPPPAAVSAAEAERSGRCTTYTYAEDRVSKLSGREKPWRAKNKPNELPDNRQSRVRPQSALMAAARHPTEDTRPKSRRAKSALAMRSSFRGQPATTATSTTTATPQDPRPPAQQKKKPPGSRSLPRGWNRATRQQRLTESCHWYTEWLGERVQEFCERMDKYKEDFEKSLIPEAPPKPQFVIDYEFEVGGGARSAKLEPPAVVKKAESTSSEHDLTTTKENAISPDGEANDSRETARESSSSTDSARNNEADDTCRAPPAEDSGEESKDAGTEPAAATRKDYKVQQGPTLSAWEAFMQDTHVHDFRQLVTFAEKQRNRKSRRSMEVNADIRLVNMQKSTRAFQKFLERNRLRRLGVNPPPLEDEKLVEDKDVVALIKTFEELGIQAAL